MANPFDQFDQAETSGNPFDQFDAPAATPKPPLAQAHGTELASAHGQPPGWTNTLASARESVLGSNSNITPQGMSPYYRMALEGVGAAAGTVAGVPAGPVGAATGGGVGFAGGKFLADMIDEAAGVKNKRGTVEKYLDPAGEMMTPGSTVERATRPIRDAAAATAMAGPAEAIVAGAQGLGRFAKGAADWAGKTMGRPQNVEKAAGDTLAAWTSNGPVYARNAAEAQELEKTINAGAKEGEPLFKFSWAEQSFDPKAVKLQRARQLNKDAAETKTQQSIDNAAALNRYFQQNFGGEEGAANVIGTAAQRGEALTAKATADTATADAVAAGTPTMPPQQAGGELLADIKTAKEPVGAALNELEAAIPDYPMKLDNLMDKIRATALDPKISADQKAAVEGFAARLQDMIPKSGPTTHNAMGIGRTLDDMTEKAFKSGDNATGRALSILKKEGLQADLEAVSSQARTGKIADYQGKAVDADALAERLENTLESLAKAKAKGGEPDVAAMVSDLKARGVPTSPVVAENEKAYAQRIQKDYERISGNPAPTKAATTTEADKLQTEADRLRGILAEVSPGQDVAAAMKAYNRFASKEWYGRFKTGAVDDVTRSGNEATGTKITVENIPKQFKTPSGADDLIRAIGPEAAKDKMRGNLAHDLIQNATDSQTGQIVSKKLTDWVGRNKIILEKYGLQNEFTGLQQAQATADASREAVREFEKSTLGKMAGIDPEKLIGKIVNSDRSAAEMNKLMMQIKGDKTAVKGLQNAFGEYVNTAAENSWQSVGGGATISQAQFTRTMQKVREAANVLYANEPEKIRALETLQRAHEIGSRTTRSPVGSGSDTVEKGMDTASSVIERIPGGWKTAAAKKILSKLNSIGQQNVDRLVNQAIFDPELATKLVRAARGQTAPDVFMAQMETLPLYPIDWKSRKIVDMREWQAQRESAGSVSGVRRMSQASGSATQDDKQ